MSLTALSKASLNYLDFVYIFKYIHPLVLLFSEALVSTLLTFSTYTTQNFS